MNAMCGKMTKVFQYIEDCPQVFDNMWFMALQASR
jgi:hypothetical protein